MITTPLMLVVHERQNHVKKIVPQLFIIKFHHFGRNLFLTFESVDEILQCAYSNKTSSTKLMYGTNRFSNSYNKIW